MLYDLIIVGGGPAGITAGIYAARKKIKTLLITKDFFGQIGSTSRVDNWPGDMGINGMTLMQRLEKHLRNFAIEIKTGQKVAAVKTVGIEAAGAGRKAAERPASRSATFTVQIESGESFISKAVIVATGRAARKLNIEGEEEFLGRGLSHCVVCDAPFFKDKQVVVIGAGNAGLEAALELVKYAKKVFIFEKSGQIRADELLQNEVRSNANIEILLRTELQKVEGQKMVQSITYKNLAAQKIFQQPMAGVFSQIGGSPVTDFLGNLLKQNRNKEIIVKPLTMETSQKGIFAAGDCNSTKHKQMVIAAGQGAEAALSAYDYLQNG